MILFGLGSGIFICLSVLAKISGRFGYDVDVIDMPVLALVLLLMLAGAMFVCLPRVLGHAKDDTRINRIGPLTWIIVAGIAMRLVFLGSEPILEDDYNRYLFDGAVTAHGYNPYSLSPDTIAQMTTGDAGLRHIAEDAGVIMERINYPQIRTVYPPIAQAAFAVAHWLKPWSLDAWRIVILACDAMVLGLILLLLREIGQPAAWIALYWWNPVVIKELYNSTHMDLLVALPMLAALLLALRQRPYSTAIAVAVGIGAKLWPVMLFPTLLRAWLPYPRVLIPALTVTAALGTLFLAPVVLAGLNESSGFVAYGSRWQANDGLFRAVLWVCLHVADLFGLPPSAGQVGARVVVGGALCIVVLAINLKPSDSPHETCRRVFITVAALLLLSPTQFPWYYVWLAVLLPLFPVRGFLLLGLTLPFYYSYFHLISRGQGHVYDYVAVLLIWLPVWCFLIADGLIRRKQQSHKECDTLDKGPGRGELK